MDRVFIKCAGGNELTLSEKVVVQRYLLTYILLENSSRPGAGANMTLEEWNKGTFKESQGRFLPLLYI